MTNVAPAHRHVDDGVTGYCLHCGLPADGRGDGDPVRSFLQQKTAEWSAVCVASGMTPDRLRDLAKRLSPADPEGADQLERWAHDVEIGL